MNADEQIILKALNYLQFVDISKNVSLLRNSSRMLFSLQVRLSFSSQLHFKRERERGARCTATRRHGNNNSELRSASHALRNDKSRVEGTREYRGMMNRPT